MPEERYAEAILKFIASRDYQPLNERRLARQLGVSEDDYGTFRSAIKRLRDTGRVVLGARNALTLPAIPERLVGFFSQNPRGFGFVTPETPNAHGDLFIPPGKTGGAMTGDRVLVRVSSTRRARNDYEGEITRILARGQNRFVGTLEESEGAWFVLPDGSRFVQPIVIRDVSAASPRAGSKVVAEIVEYAAEGKLPVGVIIENLGASGHLEAETRAVIRFHGLEERFTEEALADARAAAASFDPDDAPGREDLTGLTIVTIDPVDARDFDDAISLTREGDGLVTLGVHIADVAHFVRAGSALDGDAARRGTSVYFAKTVLPMLPEILSNGILSLQEGQRRFTKTAFITYDAEAEVVRTRLAESVIASAKRLNYEEAQRIIDGESGGYPEPVVALLRDMDALARRIDTPIRIGRMKYGSMDERSWIHSMNGAWRI